MNRQTHRCPEEEGAVAAEPEDPTAELLRRVLAGTREPDVSQTRENASSDRISRFTASQGLARLVLDQIEDMGECDQPRVRTRACEESSGKAS